MDSTNLENVDFGQFPAFIEKEKKRIIKLIISRNEKYMAACNFNLKIIIKYIIKNFILKTYLKLFYYIIKYFN